MDTSLLVHCNCSLRQKLLSSELFAAVVQHQILFGSNLLRFGLPAAKLTEGRCVLGTDTGNRPWAELWDSRGVLAAWGGFAAHSSLSAVYPSTLGTAWESRACCRLLGSSSSSWKLPTSSPDIRPVAASVSRCHFGSASAGSSCSSGIPLGSPLQLHFPWSGFTRCLLIPHSLEPVTSEPCAFFTFVLLCW